MSDKRFTPTPPRYDAVYYKGMKWLDGMASGEEEEMSDKPRTIAECLEEMVKRVEGARYSVSER